MTPKKFENQGDFFDRVYGWVYQKAIELGIPHEQAEAIAEAVAIEEIDCRAPGAN